MNIKSFIPRGIKNLWHLLEGFYANMMYGFPSHSLKIIGVTGTDGKTTTATMIYEMLKKGGLKVGLITSVSAYIGKREIDTGFHVTTPGASDIPRYLNLMLREGIEWVVLEVTSHGLDQNRIAGIEFEKAVFTNITHEHLDYHKTWRSYALAKTKLINMVKEGGDIIYNEGERGGKFIAKMISKASNVLIRNVCSKKLIKNPVSTIDGLSFSCSIKGKEEKVTIPIIGDYNMTNAQCAIKVCENLIESNIILETLREFKGIKGRMQLARRTKPCKIIIDFAHTPNALRKALKTLLPFKEKGRLIVIFGCAGLRDYKKRPMMGKIAARFADIIIITAEDPRTEKLLTINNSIINGAYENGGVLVKRFASRKLFKTSSFKKIIGNIEKAFTENKKPVLVFDDESIKSREDAIECAVKLVKPDDILLVTGKGHEKSLCFGKTEYPWSDFEAVKKAVQIKYNIPQ